MAREVPVVAVPFPVLVNETTTKQTPVSGVMVNQTSTVPPAGFVVIAV